jgi:hypothetical protein
MLKCAIHSFRFLIPALFLLSCIAAQAQDADQPLDPNDPRLTFSFPIQAGGKPFRFKVEIDRAGAATGVTVFAPGSTSPLQTLSTCATKDMQEPLIDNWGGYALNYVLVHDDLNFDGFQDLELLQYSIPHLDKKLYCIYLWDSKAGRFHYSKEITDVAVDIVVHPESKTFTTREDWMGGAWEESTYHWKGNTLESIASRSLTGDWSTQTDKECGFTYICTKLIGTESTVTLAKPVCTPEEMDNLPNCPDAPEPKQSGPGSSNNHEKETPVQGSASKPAPVGDKK